MSVLIKKMDMPQSCVFCGIAIMCYTAYGIHNGIIKKDGRLLSCPLVEVPTPHGRLIDADSAMECIKKCRAFKGDSMIILEDIFDGEPTIIEAEE